MDFMIAKCDFDRALRQVLQGRKADSADLVDMTADRAALTVVVTGRSIEVRIEARIIGSFSIPIGVLFKMKHVSRTYEDRTFRIRVWEGQFRLQGMSTSHPGIQARKVARRVIDIPEDAGAADILALPLIFNVDEIEECNLHVKLLEEQKEFADALNRAFDTLQKYGFDRNELSDMAKLKIKTHADRMKHVLFDGDLVSEDQILDMAHWMAKNPGREETSAALWMERGKGLLNQEKWIEAHECFIAGLKIEPVHPEIMYWMGVLCNDGSEIAEKLGVDWRTLPFSAWESDQWFQRSAQAGWAEAQFKCYGLSRSGIAAGIECLRNAAGQGHARAAWELTLRILSGDVDRCGLDDAVYWFYKAKAGGVGMFIETLEPVRGRQKKVQNDNLLQDWLLKAAPYGDGEAALELARFQFLALSLDDSLEEVAGWLEKAEQEGVGTVEESLKQFRAERRKQQCENAVGAGDRLAFVYAEWADRSPFEFILMFDAKMFTDEWIDNYRKHHPDVKLGNTPWWKVPGGPDYT